MTDARVPDRWLIDRRFTQLSGDQFRAFIAALTWSASNRTDGVITPEDVPEIRWLSADYMPAFVAAGLCARIDDGWLMVDFLSTQTTRAELEQRERNRVKERERKARYRAKTPDQGDVPRDRDADKDADKDADFAGKDRTGQDRHLEGDGTNDAESPDFNNGYDYESQWCWDCGDKPPVGPVGREMDDPTLCRGCNDARTAEAAEWAAGDDL